MSARAVACLLLSLISGCREAPPSPSEGPVERPVLVALCGRCHGLPSPDLLPRDRWGRIIDLMNTYIRRYGWGQPFTTVETWNIARWYVANAPVSLPALPVFEQPSPLRFRQKVFGHTAQQLHPALPGHIANLNVVDLDGDGQQDVLVSDLAIVSLTWIHRQATGEWAEDRVAKDLGLVRTAVADLDGDGDLDIAAAVLGSFPPTDALSGRLVLLFGDGAGGFERQVLRKDLPRIADLQPADFDGDGDVDLVVAMFGAWGVGELGWLERGPRGRYTYHQLDQRPGYSHVPVGDLDGDGRPDFVALISQHFEQVILYLNRTPPGGPARLEPWVLAEGGHPLFGSSGLTLHDLDGDGDLDVLWTNGDALDNDSLPKPYHGVQWLENGGIRAGAPVFTYHDIGRLYGAYAAAAGDLDGDGDQDVVAVSQLNDWNDPRRASLVWYQNDGQQGFTRYNIATAPTHLATVALFDADRDGRLDIVAGGLHIMPPFDRTGRITLWLNRGPR